MIAEALMEANPKVAKLTLHSDNGAPMKHKGLCKFCEKSDIQQSYSRPHTSNDNAFIESHFSTMKSRNSYPEMFSNLASAEFWVEKRNVQMNIAREAFPSRFGSRKKIKQPTETRLKHRAQMPIQPDWERKKQERKKSFSDSETCVVAED